MKLIEKDIFAICDKVRDILDEGNCVIPVENIYTQTPPNSDIPNDYILISGNGGFVDKGDISNCIVLIEVNSKLLQDKSINKVRLRYIMNNLSGILDKSIVEDNYYFSISKDYNIFDNIDVSLGYATKMLNIHCTINRTLIN